MALAPFLNVFGGGAPFREPPPRLCPHGQGRLKIWTKHSNLTNFDDFSYSDSSAQGFLYKSILGDGFSSFFECIQRQRVSS